MKTIQHIVSFCLLEYLHSEFRNLLSHSNVKGSRHYMAQFITVSQGGRKGGWEGALSLLV